MSRRYMVFFLDNFDLFILRFRMVLRSIALLPSVCIAVFSPIAEWPHMFLANFFTHGSKFYCSECEHQKQYLASIADTFANYVEKELFVQNFIN